MRAEDLMIGDWVQFPYGIRKVTELDGFLNRICSEDSSVGEVNAIPLTKEILEKNGFECDANPNYICDSYFIDGISLIDFRSGYFKYATITLEYVHQLQHLLKLRNIDKEIEL